MSKTSTSQIATAILNMSKSSGSKKLSSQIAAYLVKERRSEDLDQIMREVKRQREAKDGIVEADLWAAFPASSDEIKHIMKLIDVDKYIINKIEDKEMVGGVRVEASGKSLDLTVRNRLNQLKGEY